ncbi:MAG: radical SAM family heme chaperone HemW [Chthoniobacterales bacterium]
MVEHLYVHIPFCPKICPYCSFYKEASDRNKTQAFLDAVLAEARQYGATVKPKTVFFGGGTPSALSTRQLDYLLGGLHRLIDFSAVTEWTLEMNPATVSLEKAELLLKHGVNRISMGVQSWDEKLLIALGRVHDRAQALRSYKILREAKVPNINLDFIFGIPGQTRETWEETLRTTASLQPEHISAYCLTYEEDTDFMKRLQSGAVRPDEELDADLFEMTRDILAESDFAQYEISNYSRPGKECLHNLGYWEGDDYVGLGPSAFSTVGARRWKNISDTAEYIRRVNEKLPVADFIEDLNDQTRLAERIAFSLRTNRGIPQELLAPYSSIVNGYVDLGLMQPASGRWQLTRKGLLVADEIVEAFI